MAQTIGPNHAAKEGARQRQVPALQVSMGMQSEPVQQG
jgi:hypothetical protein